MTIEAPHTTGLFAELLEGANALAQRPTLIAERDQAHLEMRAAQDRADRFASELERVNAAVEQLKTELSAKEAALAQATFHHSELGSKLSLVASVLKDVMGNATAAMELVEPPKPEPVTVDPTVFTPEASGVETPSVGDAVDSTPAIGSSTTGSVAPTAPVVGTTSTSASATEVDLPGTYPWDTTGPNVTLTVPEGQEATVDNSTAASSPKPYWEKPTGEEWLSWAKAGNDVAPWVAFNWYEKQELEALKRA